MKKIVLLIPCLYFLFTTSMYAVIVREPQVDKITQLEDRITQNEKYFGEILQTQRFISTLNITTLIGITVLILAVSGFFGFRTAKEHIKNELEKFEDGLKKFRENLESKLEKGAKELQDGTEKRLKDFQSYHSREFRRAFANQCNAIGRIYEKEYPCSSALWYARGLEVYIELGDYTDKWIILQIKYVTSNLRKPFPIPITSDDVVEYKQIISKIDSTKFGEQKKELEKALEENLEKKGKTK